MNLGDHYNPGSAAPMSGQVKEVHEIVQVVKQVQRVASKKKQAATLISFVLKENSNS